MININKLQPEYTGHEQLLKEYAHLFDGIGTLKNFEVKLHIDENVPPVAQSPLPSSDSLSHASKGFRSFRPA